MFIALSTPIESSSVGAASASSVTLMKEVDSGQWSVVSGQLKDEPNVPPAFSFVVLSPRIMLAHVTRSCPEGTKEGSQWQARFVRRLWLRCNLNSRPERAHRMFESNASLTMFLRAPFRARASFQHRDQRRRTKACLPLATFSLSLQDTTALHETLR